MFELISQIIGHGTKELNITLPLSSEAALGAYYDYLAQRSKLFNLTAITEPEDVARLHFLDSIALLGAISLENERVIDVGCGAGFPGLVLKIVRPGIDLTLLDATGKKIKFLSEISEILQVDVNCIHARAEEVSRERDKREVFDVAVSRAVAELRVLSELCLPFVKVGGLMVAMKSVNSDEEIKNAEPAMTTLGAKLESIYDYKIPETDIAHRAVLIRKTSKTPDTYPRRFARIQNFPL
ncbi:MAG: 16S rRNA (guanine(527)-N(7))-methyltransferase RsmG [Oscillospiraceae bacterium]|nr:16S rRNA (guanine(527)-N(7))-methyltransferase RsmG [Oscillospiraceae bacterium]